MTDSRPILYSTKSIIGIIRMAFHPMKEAPDFPSSNKKVFKFRVIWADDGWDEGSWGHSCIGADVPSDEDDKSSDYDAPYGEYIRDKSGERTTEAAIAWLLAGEDSGKL